MMVLDAEDNAYQYFVCSGMQTPSKDTRRLPVRYYPGLVIVRVSSGTLPVRRKQIPVHLRAVTVKI